MSLVTTCPSCGTSFRITPEQLSAHRGDVRCGHCQHIFSALKQLEEIVPPAPKHQEPPATAAHQEPPLPEETPIPQEVPFPEEILMPPEIVEVETTAPAEEESLPEVEELHLDPAALDFELEAAEEPTAETTVETSLPAVEEIEIIAPHSWVEDVPPREEAIAEEPAMPPQPPAPAAAAVLYPEPPPSKAIEKTRRRLPPWLLVLLTLLLILTALGQSIYFLRNDIASRYPQTAPWLANFCLPFHCSIELPRQADLLSIEDSDLKDDPEHDGVLILVSTLDNRASFTQAFPLLELTLTDTFDHPLMRRIFTPSEYLPPETSIARGMAAGAQIAIRLNLQVEGAKPAGYRLYVKY